jgi:prepilin-type N-terminal cleavage/methylation domain-containing protein
VAWVDAGAGPRSTPGEHHLVLRSAKRIRRGRHGDDARLGQGYTFVELMIAMAIAVIIGGVYGIFVYQRRRRSRRIMNGCTSASR